MRDVTFDIHQQTYEPNSQRIISTLVIGGYKTWIDAVLAEWVLIKSRKITSFTIRQCTHTNNTYANKKHRALTNEQDLKEILVS